MVLTRMIIKIANIYCVGIISFTFQPCVVDHMIKPIVHMWFREISGLQAESTDLVTKHEGKAERKCLTKQCFPPGKL